MEKKIMHQQDMLTNLRQFLGMYINIIINTFNLNMFKTKLRISAPQNWPSFWFYSLSKWYLHPSRCPNQKARWRIMPVLHSSVFSLPSPINHQVLIFLSYFSHLPISLLLSAFPWFRPSALVWVITWLLTYLPAIHPTAPQYILLLLLLLLLLLFYL